MVCVSVCLLSFLAVGRSCLPILDPLSSVVGVGQVSIQSADAQEQVEGLLTENNALRTSLAALEQVQDTCEPSLIPPHSLISFLIHSQAAWFGYHAVYWSGFCFSFLLPPALFSLAIHPCFSGILISLQ